MVAFKFLALALSVWGVLADDPWMPPGMTREEYDELTGARDGKPLEPGMPAGRRAEPEAPPELNVDVTTTFPEAEIFGVKLVNGKQTKAHVEMINQEPLDISLRMIFGQLWTPLDRPGSVWPPQPIANLTMKGFMVKIPPGEKRSADYVFSTTLMPQDVNLVLQAVWQKSDKKGELVQKVVYNGTVSAVEPSMSIFDPQILFLYLFLALAFGGTGWFIYSTWVTTFFPQKRRGGKGGERAKRSSGGSKAVDPADQVSVIGADGPATTSGAKAYDESWIPAEHLQRPQAKRVGSGRPKSRAA